MDPLVSILIPAHNAGRWIGESIESALEQTWPRKEIIVVDDGSSDSTRAIAQAYEGRAVKVLVQEKRGASGARNTALAHAQGDWIQWLDADDVLAPDKVARQVEVARSLSPLILISGPWAYFYHKIRRARPHPTALWADHTPVEWLILKMADNLHMQTGSWLTSRALTTKAGPYDERLWRDNDGEYFARAVAASEGIRFVPDAAVFYRQISRGSVTHMQGSNPKRDSLFLSINLHIQYLRSLEDSPRVRAVCVQFIQNWLLEFYPERPDLVAKFQDMARQLGGTLSEPRLRPKYRWLCHVVGLPMAKRISETLPRWRLTFTNAFDALVP